MHFGKFLLDFLCEFFFYIRQSCGFVASAADAASACSAIFRASITSRIYLWFIFSMFKVYFTILIWLMPSALFFFFSSGVFLFQFLCFHFVFGRIFLFLLHFIMSTTRTLRFYFVYFRTSSRGLGGGAWVNLQLSHFTSYPIEKIKTSENFQSNRLT